VFAFGELALAGTFFLLPFAVGALVACILAFLDVGLGVQWLAFVGISALGSAALIPLRARLDRNDPGSSEGIGSRRLVGQPALVTAPIHAGPHGRGMVRVGREEWRAETVDELAVAPGVVVRVVEVRGTGVVVTSVPHVGPSTAPATDPSHPGAQ
jgi:membrane protein implicated in regulation of membrane protease activity